MRAKQTQAGFALIIMMVILIGIAMAGIARLLNTSVNSQQEKARIENQKILLLAKQALMGYALNYINTGNINDMGRLPCPDASGASNAEGAQDTNCGTTSHNSIGYLPYRTLGLGKLLDADHECLWYVVSGDYKQTPASELNWDSIGYLNIKDENDEFLHPTQIDEFPVALIISAGKSINQDRSVDAALPECRANFNVTAYLEGGPNIDYSTDLPDSPDTLWSFLSSSVGSDLDNPDYNDRIIGVYKEEIWSRIETLGDLEADDSSAVDTFAELVTRDLALCLASYGNHPNNTHFTLPFAAPVDLTDYRVSANYDDQNGLLYGRFPQNINHSELPGGIPGLIDVISNESSFVSDGSGTGYCNLGVANEDFWNNWKDHFFYVVGNDFKPNPSPTFPLPDRCNDKDNCIQVDNKDELAAVVFFAGKKRAGQSRVWTPSIDDKDDVTNYLEDANTVFYNGSTEPDFKVQDPGVINDYAYCVEFDPSAGFSATLCTAI